MRRKLASTSFQTKNKAYQLDIGPHLCNLSHLDHDQLVHLWIFLFIVPHPASAFLSLGEISLSVGPEVVVTRQEETRNPEGKNKEWLWLCWEVNFFPPCLFFHTIHF